MIAEEEENLFEDDSAKILSLFRKRTVANLNLSQEKYEKLYENLSCTICRELYNNPVYLKCSHRFCKDCIEKYIRSSDKKSCPNCRGALTTKRDLRNDYMLISMITYAFGNVNDFKNKIDIFESQTLKNMKFVKTERGIQCQAKRQRTQSQSKQLTTSNKSPKKKVMAVRNSEVEETIVENENKLKRIFSEGQTPLNKTQIQPHWTRTMRKKLKEQNEKELKKEEKRNEIEHEQKVNVKENDDHAVNEQQNENNEKERQRSYIDEEEGEIIGQKSQLQEENTSGKAMMKARQIIIKRYGVNYMKNLIAETKSPCIIKIKLQRLAESLFSPKLKSKYIMLSLQSTVSDVAKIIAQKLNIENKSVVRLHITNSQGRVEQILNRKTTKIGQLIEDYWSSFEGVGVFDMKDILGCLTNENSSVCQKLQKVLYYRISYETLIKK